MKKAPRIRKLRHTVARNILAVLLPPVVRLKFGAKITKHKDSEKRPYLILYNHQTSFDQFFVSLAFRRHVYHVASDDLFSNGFTSAVIRYLVAPIPIKKQAVDISAIKNCLKIARDGGSIAMAPEGNRTYSGRTEYMSPTVAPLAKRIGLPIALFRIEGGYGVQPRWSDGTRRGRMRAFVSRVIEPEEYASMTDDELFVAIQNELTVDETKCPDLYKSKKLAEYLERALYVCPDCGITHFVSHGNTMTCEGCGKRVIYHENKQLTGDGFDLPFSYVADWYDYQKDFVNALNPMQYTQKPLCLDAADIREVIPCKAKHLLVKNAPLALYGDRVVLGDMVLPFEEILAASVLGRNKLNLYHGDKLYQLKGDKRFNALKYVNLYYRYKNLKKEINDGKFLGL